MKLFFPKFCSQDLMFVVLLFSLVLQAVVVINLSLLCPYIFRVSELFHWKNPQFRWVHLFYFSVFLWFLLSIGFLSDLLVFLFVFIVLIPIQLLFLIFYLSSFVGFQVYLWVPLLLQVWNRSLMLSVGILFFLILYSLFWFLTWFFPIFFPS